jgi:hypothetical protein
MMLNLFINAIQVMSDVRDSKREPHVTTGVVESGESIRVALRDIGPGPSAENVEGLLQPFHTTKPDGMGTVFSICRSIIEDHRGRLWESRIEPPRCFVSVYDASCSAGHIIIRSVSLFGTNRRLEDVCAVRTATTMGKTVLLGKGKNT